MSDSDEFLKASNVAELKLVYVRALAGMRPGDADRVAPLRRAYRARSRELGAVNTPPFVPVPHFQAPEPEMLPPPKKAGCSRWFWVAVGTYGILRLLTRLIGG